VPFKPSFSPMMLEPIRDANLTAPHWRVLASVLFHDRLSLPKEKGKGCNAKNLTIAEETGNLPYAVVCRCLSDLVKWGYLAREKAGRETIYRGVYTERKTIKDCPIPPKRKGDKCVTNPDADSGDFDPAISDDGVIEPEIIGDEFADFSAPSRSDETENQAQYITLRGVIDTPKEGKENSLKGRTVPARGLAEWREAFDRLPDGAKVARFEEAWKAHPEWFESERERWARWLFDVADTYQGENNAIWAQAGRLWEEIAPC